MKPSLDTLGPCAQLTVYEHALRTAQQTIDELRDKVRKLEGELAIERAARKEIGQYAPFDGMALERLLESQTAFSKASGAIKDPPHACHPAQRVPVVPEPHEL